MTPEEPIEIFGPSTASVCFWYVIGFLFVLLFTWTPVYLFLWPGSYKDSGNLVPIIFLMIVAILIALVAFASAKTRIEIYSSRICKVNPFRTWQLMLDDVEGFFIRSKVGIVLVPKRRGLHKMVLGLGMERYDDLERWLYRNFDNLDKMAN